MLPLCVFAESELPFDGLPFNTIPVTLCRLLLIFNKYRQIDTGFTMAIRGRMLSA